ncbi:MAG: LysR family transcriptional regulator [Oscillospiraceae bacterium]|nr:LysR family transcriptional regulator [Oscillospiraceae bacterium]
MNFRSCKYFLTICQMGTINAAARKLYISPQSLSQHIKKLEEELDVQLFHRDNPLTLTEAGTIVKQAATDILETISQMERDLSDVKGNTSQTLTIGTLDYGIPDFIPPLIDIFLKQEPNVLMQTREIAAGGEIPEDIPLLISARELGGSYKCEMLFSDSLVVCVADSLLKKCYGENWLEHKRRLMQGELQALTGCPFVKHRNTPLEGLSEMAFSQNHFVPSYLPVMGTINTLSRFCINGQAAMITFLGQAKSEPQLPEAYLIENVPESIPTGYICWHSDVTLTAPAQRFLDITRRYFKRNS